MNNPKEYSNKKFYSVREFYKYTKDAFKSLKYMKQALKTGLIDKGFQSRIMLAVTEINGCEMCNIFHTGEALKSGMSNKEIKLFLSGDLAHANVDEGVAIFFAQHYAKTKGYPDIEAWNRVVNEYGRKKALGILGTVRAIMFGNTSGIAIGALISRFKFKPVKNSSFSYELKILLSTFIFVPIAIIHSNFSKQTDLFLDAR